MLQILGGGAQAFGGLEESEIESRNLEYESYIARQDASLIQEAGDLEEGKARTQRRKLLARQVAIAAASGMDISGGSPLAVIEASERAGILDEQIIAFNKNIAVGRKLSEAALLYGASRSVEKAGKVGFFTSLLGTGAKAYKGFDMPTKGRDIKKSPKSMVPKRKTPRSSGGFTGGKSTRYGPAARPY